jgi:DNA-binding transcriptional MerR regulator
MLRLYSREDLRKVRLIRQLGEMGLNLAGVEFALKTVDHLLELKDRLTAMVEDGPSKNLIQREIDRVFESLNLPTDD